ncbi:MAG: SRPBCC domain-containing protein [Alphaproteobacteria bacterium]|nr:SRPBCC domain-containing protein [Alphaproteobacteria bacterium]
MQTFEHRIAIPAPPEQVWQALLDFRGWAAWSFVRPVASRVDLRVGGRFPLRIHLRRGVVVPARARLVAVEPGRALVWKGGARGLFTAVHGFELAPDGAGCTVRHHERFDGALSAAVLRLLGPGHAARYAEANEGLARRVVSSRP